MFPIFTPYTLQKNTSSSPKYHHIEQQQQHQVSLLHFSSLDMFTSLNTKSVFRKLKDNFLHKILDFHYLFQFSQVRIQL